ncbi:Putative flippase GtrA (transmembrane translocase of bactoprenol-linked glucose) [Glycomyces harbinensis]|uniref:Putative flippase GtrA (Transmembrane translocase of bactoprenol-linked glucose) n=2 Tax=Glycomyces harbinensis TaxID=58114 RepID=A0A1G7D1Y2_9ACTN|nr:Putative flippase GtrA (transmembrane translocase of bactoprenol-linked glucose) [Glycomyces harbinensis]
MHRHRPLLMRLARFSTVGMTCFAIQAGLLLALRETGVPDTLANAIGFLVSAQVNFLLSTRFTWSDRRLPRPAPRRAAVRWLSFQTTVALSLACNTGVFALASQFTGPVAAAAAGVGLGALLTFLASNHLIFRGRRAETAPPTEHLGADLDDHRRAPLALTRTADRTATAD